VSSTTYRVSHLSDPRQIATSLNIARRKTDALDLSDDQSTLLVDRPATISGDVSAVNGSFSGNVGGVNAILTGNVAAVNVNLSGVYQIATLQVVGPRQTGWTADTGTAEKTAHATYTAGATLTFSSSYTQSELTALATRLAAVEAALQAATRGQKALKDSLITHGLIGT
jgi:hypothetical protein